MSKIVYRPLGMVLSILGGVLASFMFSKVWQAATGEPEAPKATERHRSWGDVLAAATLQGAVFGLVKAAVDRGGATGFRRATGAWPGEE